MAMLPVISRERGSDFSSVAHCCSLRPSFHRMAGRSGLSLASSNVAPCIWPERPTALTALRVAAGSAFTAALVALHQSAGFCSDHPACGRDTFSGAEACSTTVSLSSTITALTLDVPISMPRYIHPLWPLGLVSSDGVGFHRRPAVPSSIRRGHDGPLKSGGNATRNAGPGHSSVTERRDRSQPVPETCPIRSAD